MQIFKSACLCLVLVSNIFLSACGFMNKQEVVNVGNVPSDSYIVNTIAYDAVEQLASIYAPGHTVFYVASGNESNPIFSTAFENLLRQKAFTVTSVASVNAITLSYLFDSVKESSMGEWYLNLELSDGQRFTRIYDNHGVPESGFMQLQLSSDEFNSYEETGGENNY